jgi:hypothetical protein
MGFCLTIDMLLIEWGTRLGWQARTAVGLCSVGVNGNDAAVKLNSCESSGDLHETFFNVSEEGSISCKKQAKNRGGAAAATSLGSCCTSVHAHVLHAVARRVDLTDHVSVEAQTLTELQSLDNMHLPLGPRVAVLMTGELRSFAHAVSR